MFNFIVFVIVALIASVGMISAGGWWSVGAITVLVVIALVVGAIGLIWAFLYFSGKGQDAAQKEAEARHNELTEKADKDFSESISDEFSQNDKNFLGYYFAAEGSIHIYHEHKPSSYGEADLIEKSASSEEEAQKIFDFFVLKTLFWNSEGRGIFVDEESHSIRFEIFPTCSGQWFPFEGLMKVHADGVDTREWPAKNFVDAECVLEAFSWELGLRTPWSDKLWILVYSNEGGRVWNWTEGLEDERSSLFYDIKVTANKDGSVIFEAGGSQGNYSGEHIQLRSPPDVEQETVPVKNRMEAILAFKDFLPKEI